MRSPTTGLRSKRSSARWPSTAWRGPDNPFGTELKGHIDAYGERYSTWRHGAVHGIIMSIMFILPVIVINALFERRGFKYIMINWGFWAVSIMLMFTVVAQFS
jgi:hypothetical protein